MDLVWLLVGEARWTDAPIRTREVPPRADGGAANDERPARFRNQEVYHATTGTTLALRSAGWYL